MASEPHILLIVENEFSRARLVEKIRAHGLGVTAASAPAELNAEGGAGRVLLLDLAARGYDLASAMRSLRRADGFPVIGIAPATHGEMIRRARNADIGHILDHDKLDAFLAHLASAAGAAE